MNAFQMLVLQGLAAKNTMLKRLTAGLTFRMNAGEKWTAPVTKRYGVRAGRVMSMLKKHDIPFGVEVLRDGRKPVCRLIFSALV